jgi:Transcriptional regulator PadR-like family/Virulence activator alpha C-term
VSVRQGILALLSEQPMHGYQLRQQFEQRTGGTWPLNIGQVYTTVQRLVRDGLVEPVPAPGAADDVADDAADSDAADAVSAASVERFRLTRSGRQEIAHWWRTPVDRGAPARDELVIKLALAVTAPGIDARDVIQAQRTETMRALRDYTLLKTTVPGGAAGGGAGEASSRDLAWSLVLDNLIFAAEAEVRWLDHVEARVSRAEGAWSATPASAGAPAAHAPGGVPSSAPPTSAGAAPSSSPAPAAPSSETEARR